MDDTVVVRGITPKEVQKYETLFKLYDENDNGSISLKELGDLMPRLGVFLTDDELYQLFCDVDVDGSGAIEFHEFLQLMSRHKEATQLALLESGRHGGETRSTTFSDGVLHALRTLTWPRDGTFRCTWDVLTLLSTQYFLLLALPSLVIGDFDTVRSFQLGAAVVYVLDIPMRGRSLNGEGKLTTEYWRTAGFVVDVFAALPLDLVLHWSGDLDAANYVRLLRLFKLLRVGATLQIAAGSREIFSATYTRFHFAVVPLLKISFWAVACVHCLAIVWCWISDSSDYGEALYLVVYTLTTVGYGDVSVRTQAQRTFCTFLFCCATVVTGLVTGKLVQLNQQADLQTDLRRKMLETLAALEHLRIPSDFTQEVLAFQYHRVRNSHSLYQEHIGGLPQAMQDRMSLYARMKMVKSVQMFAHAPEVCLAKLAQSLVDVVVPPEEHIIIAGEEGREMFFLFYGMCDVRLVDGRLAATIRKGGFFGEMALLQKTVRAASIKSITYCQLFRLDKTEFDSIMEQFPALAASIRQQAEQRQAEQVNTAGGDGESQSQEQSAAEVPLPGEVSTQQSPQPTPTRGSIADSPPERQRPSLLPEPPPPPPPPSSAPPPPSLPASVPTSLPPPDLALSQCGSVDAKRSPDGFPSRTTTAELPQLPPSPPVQAPGVRRPTFSPTFTDDRGLTLDDNVVNGRRHTRSTLEDSCAQSRTRKFESRRLPEGMLARVDETARASDVLALLQAVQETSQTMAMLQRQQGGMLQKMMSLEEHTMLLHRAAKSHNIVQVDAAESSMTASAGTGPKASDAPSLRRRSMQSTAHTLVSQERQLES